MERPKDFHSQPWNMQEYTNQLESQLKEVKEENERLKQILIPPEGYHETGKTMNDFEKCDTCGNHPATIIRTGKGIFCQEHAKY